MMVWVAETDTEPIVECVPISAFGPMAAVVSGVSVISVMAAPIAASPLSVNAQVATPIPAACVPLTVIELNPSTLVMPEAAS